MKIRIIISIYFSKFVFESVSTILVREHILLHEKFKLDTTHAVYIQA